ncbi:hypothetical protein V8G54_031141 [Vigna mungo]|uniref:Transmembrane protein n=1 Tax=Vigna mungo TaxID=3915 RepID=A0AAQ3MXK4_VIGMU
MDTIRIKSVSFLILVLLASLSESRPLPIYAPSKDGVITEVNGVFRTLKSSGPRPGIGHKFNRLQNLGGMKEAGPSPVVYGHHDTVLSMNSALKKRYKEKCTMLPVMAGKFQSLAFIVLIVWCSSWSNIKHATARPLNTVVLHADAVNEPRRNILELSNVVLRGGQKNNVVRKLVVDNSGPSPDGPGHKGSLPFYTKPKH